MRLRGCVVASALATALSAVPERAAAQVAPNESWRSIKTAHFHVHFTPELERLARRAAAEAELAYEALATGARGANSATLAGLHRPRGPIDLVVADNVDFTNGYAQPFPSNRIVVYAQPPVGVNSLRAYDDWMRIVITHELAHIFHLDRSRGWWRAAQHIFGRNPYLFPHVYTPDWITEGLAVVYESGLTGAGRLNASNHAMIARAASGAGALPRLGDISAATSRFPEGQSVYGYGSLFLSFMERRYGSRGGVARLVNELARDPFPFRLNRAAKRAYGVSFDRGWREWRDSLRAAGALDTVNWPTGGWRELTKEGRFAHHPRWLDDSTLVYVASTGKKVTGAYSVGLNGRARRLTRRNGLEPNVPLNDGALLFSQLEYRSPVHIRSDLYVERDGRVRRLTKDARLTLPDARADGVIVAVQAIPGATRLVRVSADGRVIAPVTRGTEDEQWTDPRWSPDGTRIAAIRWQRGGYTDLVMLDTAGAVLASTFTATATASGQRIVVSTPSWSSDGRWIFFSSDQSGETRAYRAAVEASGFAAISPAAAPSGGVFTPEPSPDERQLAAAVYRADGFHIAVTPLTAGTGSATPAMDSIARSEARERYALPPPASDSTPSRRYTPWRTLAPRSWSLEVRDNGDGLELGGWTTGVDVIGRHAYVTELTGNVEHRELNGAVSYRYSRPLRPFLDATVSQRWDSEGLIADGTTNAVLGELRQRTRIVSLGATFVRPRFRSNASLTLGGELERRYFATEPDSLLPRLPAVFNDGVSYRALIARASWGNAQYPGFAISPENGFGLAGSAKVRWRRGTDDGPASVLVGSANGYRGLDLGGFAHHVVALRTVGGWTDRRETLEFSIGGISGSEVEVVPGVALGSQRRNFPVRGFPVAARQGSRAASASAEFRAPLARPSRGVRLLPLFLDRVSVTAFSDAASAWCTGTADTSSLRDPCGGRRFGSNWIASAGAELNLDASIFSYDAPLRVRLGIAAPIHGREQVAADAVTAYLTFGASF